ncbi:MAG: DUF4199 domain-containing protein [Cyclobacteriaceae bacterium]|nr:DUF4199 domain-containing protein [Cyclobacteriaceae bacterium]
MIRGTFKFSLAAGVFICTLFALSGRMGSNPFTDINQLFFDLILLGVFIFFSINEFKKYTNGGVLHFWQGMTIGFFVYTLAIALFIAFLYLYFYFDGNLLDDYKATAMAYLQQRADLYKEQFGEAQYLAQEEAIRQTTTNHLILVTSVKKILVGLFITPVLSILLRSKPKN